MDDLSETKAAWAELFDALAPGYDHPALRHFPFCADRLVERARPRPGEKVLDVGAGTGAVTVAAAQRVRPGGRVQAIDLAPAMLAEAAEQVRRLGLDNVDFHQMDGERLEFRSRYFDLVLGGFCLFFFDDPGAGLRRWHRVLKPGGRTAFTVFGGRAFSPLAEQLRADLAAMGVEPDPPQWQSLSTPEQCEALLQQAGFTEIEITAEQMGHHLSGPEEWWDVVQHSGLRTWVEHLPAEAREDFRARHLEAVAALAGDKGIWMDVETLFCHGRRPD